MVLIMPNSPPKNHMFRFYVVKVWVFSVLVTVTFCSLVEEESTTPILKPSELGCVNKSKEFLIGKITLTLQLCVLGLKEIIESFQLDE